MNDLPEESAPAEDVSERTKQLLGKLWNDPSIGRSVRKAAKEMFPDIATPEDYAEPFVKEAEERHKALADELKALKKSLEEKEEKERLSSKEQEFKTAFDNAVKKYGLSEDGVRKMFDRMKETGNVSDPDAAAAWVIQSNPPAKTNARLFSGPGRLKIFEKADGGPDYDLLKKNPEAFLDQELSSFGSDPDGFVKSAGY